MIRSNLNWYDEAGKIEKEFYALTKPFAVQNTDFITGKGVSGKCYPRQFPNQIILSSSAEDIFTELYSMYKQGAYEMIMGNRDYFVCDIDCNFSLHPKMRGKPYTPMVKQQVIDEAIQQNEFRANREYFNKFDITGGQDALTNLMVLLKNSRGYVPVFENEDDHRQYVITYDPSSKLDNSIVLISEIYEDPEKGWMLKIVNCINLIEKKKGGKKIIIQKPQQVERIKQLLLDYNGKALDYKNIEQIIIDAGSGGGGFDFSQYMLPNWLDDKGKEHFGIIDKKDKYTKEIMDRFPAAVDILTLANFTRDKVVFYEDTQDALNQGLVIFPKSLNSRQEMEFERLTDKGEIEYYFSKLDKKEVESIVEIDVLKYELMAMQKTKNTQTGRVSFDTIPSKKNEGMHDDRADCLAMACHYLMNKRRTERLNVPREKTDFSKILTQKNQITTTNKNPFSATNNPFSKLGKNPFLR